MRLTKNLFFIFKQLKRWGFLPFLLGGCIRLEPIATVTPLNSETALPPPIIVTSTVYYGWTDANFVMKGVCFAAAEQRLGQVYTIRDAAALDTFYNQLDRDKLCEASITRETLPFEPGDVLVGTWSGGSGCTAEHFVQNIERNDTNRTLNIALQLATQGDCPYELIRPFWIVVKNADGFKVQITVSDSP